MSLFFKILLWFAGTVVLSLTVLTVATTWQMDAPGYERPPGIVGPGPRPGHAPPGRRPPLGFMFLRGFEEARYAYESGGRDELKQVLDRIRDVTGSEACLTDGKGRDLVTGADRSDLLSLARKRDRMPVPYRNQSVVARQSLDGQYYFFAFIRRGNWFNWFFQPTIHLPLLAVLLLLCYALAHHLTAPVRKLQAAVVRFGQGDLSARANDGRKDELGQLARTFDQMAGRIQTLLSAERRLLLDISHELRSPLARLGVAVELARSGEADREFYLQRIERESERLNVLLGELLQVTRAEGDRTQMRAEVLDLTRLVSEVVADCRIEATARGCQVTEDVAGSYAIKGDAELLRRALENVLRNAIRYAPPESVVSVALTREGTTARIAIADSGPGVPEEDLGRIFDPFYRVQTDRNRETGGAGLGLAIAQRALHLHGGSIVAGNLHPGLAVTIRLPVYSDGNRPDPSA